MNTEKGLNLKKLDLLTITNDYLNGRISFEVYRTLEREWAHRYSRPKFSESFEEILRKDQKDSNVGKIPDE